MKYLKKDLRDYSVEEMMEGIKNYYLIKGNGPALFREIILYDVPNIREIFGKLKDEGKVEDFETLYGESVKSMILKRENLLHEYNFPQCGDFIKLKTGQLLRVTIDRYDEEFQSSLYEGSFHLGESGGMSFSGTCGDLFYSENFKLTNDFEIGSFWCWNPKKGVGPGNGIYSKALFRVFTEIQKESL